MSKPKLTESCRAEEEEEEKNTQRDSIPYWLFADITVPCTCRVLHTSSSLQVGPGSSVGIATELRAGRSGDRIPVGARLSAPVQTGHGAHPASYKMGTRSFPGVEAAGAWG